MASRQPRETVEFGPFRLNLKNRRLLCHGEEVRLGNRAMELLIALARRKGEVVTKKELFDAGWPGIFVEQGNLKVTIASLRRSLRKHSGSDAFIKTFSNRGYWLRDQAEDREPNFNDPQGVSDKRIPELGSVIGRDDEIAALRKSIETSRLTTVVGAGGIGKTTIAAAVARLIEEKDEVSVTFVDLSRIAGEEYVVPSLAAVLGVISGSQDRLEGISSVLAARPNLLVLDTCEHVANAVAHVSDVIIAKTKSVRILCTSRQPIRARHEKLLWLEPLGVPPADRPLAPEEVLNYPAPNLLLKRASEAGEYEVEKGDEETIATICRTLDGLPLAIELIAPRLLVESPAEVLKEIDDSFAGFVNRDPEVPARQRTLLATLEWSYALLTETEAAVLRTGSIFVGPFEGNALLRLIGHRKLDSADVFDALAGLRSKSMVSIESSADELRYRLLDCTRAFAANLLKLSGEGDKVSAAYARHVLHVFEKANIEQAKLLGQHSHSKYATRAEELRKAISWALYSNGDPLLGMELVAAGVPLWHELSMMEEARRNCELALATFDRGPFTDISLKLKLLLGLAGVTRFLSTGTDEAISIFEATIKLSREVGDNAAECQGLVALASYRLLPGYRTAAREILQQLKRVASQSANRAALWEHDTLLAEIDIIRSDYPRVITRLERLREQIQNVSNGTVSRFDADIRIRTENTLGAAQWLGSHRPGTGLSRVQNAARWALEAHHGWTLIYCFTRGVLFILTKCRDLVLSKHCTERLKQAIERYEVPSWTPVANCYGAALEALMGYTRDPQAIMSAFAGLRTGLRQHGRHVYFALLVRALYAIGSADPAGEILDYVFDIGPQQSMLPELLRLRAVGERARGRDDDALATLEKSLEVAETNGSWAWQVRSATDLAVLHRDKRRLQDARNVLEPVYGRFLDGFETPDLQSAGKVLSELDGAGRLKRGIILADDTPEAWRPRGGSAR